MKRVEAERAHAPGESHNPRAAAAPGGHGISSDPFMSRGKATQERPSDAGQRTRGRGAVPSDPDCLRIRVGRLEKAQAHHPLLETSTNQKRESPPHRYPRKSHHLHKKTGKNLSRRALKRKHPRVSCRVMKKRVRGNLLWINGASSGAALPQHRRGRSGSPERIDRPQTSAEAWDLDAEGSNPHGTRRARGARTGGSEARLFAEAFSRTLLAVHRVTDPPGYWRWGSESGGVAEVGVEVGV